LPTELQTMIWEEAYYLSNSVPQVIEGFVETGRPVMDIQALLAACRVDGDGKLRLPRQKATLPSYMVFPSTKEKYPTPVILSVCRQSREVAFRLGGGFSSVFVEFEKGAKRPIWFNFSSDIVRFTNLFAQAVEGDGWRSKDNQQDRKRVKHLALEWSYFHQGWQGGRFTSDEDEEDYRWHWLETVCDLYTRLPYLTDLYLFVPAVRLERISHRSAEELTEEVPQATL
ncbi:hypothetical protein FQN49_006183, partial [Arthroderma sp. PD_2]